MLSISQTQDHIVKRIRQVYEPMYVVSMIRRDDQQLVISVSCIVSKATSAKRFASQATEQRKIGSDVVHRIQRMQIKSKPNRIGYSLTGREAQTVCNANEVIILCEWRD